MVYDDTNLGIIAFLFIAKKSAWRRFANGILILFISVCSREKVVKYYFLL